ncbi:MAG: xanthine dehydrogenase family protein subunit M [SAR202 cluster bacterium]|nr:xanthine dehydrogenase family protein subunit M [SAR202 cluster bacterium]
MKWIDYERPSTVAEAVKILSKHGEKARAFAGGTDILVQLRGGRRAVDVLVDSKGIAELNELSFDPKKGLTVGAAVPCYKIYGDKKIAAAYPGLIDSATIIGGIQIQGRASLGGNLCNAAPSADGIPAMIAYNGVATIAGPKGRRKVNVEDFCTAPGKTVLKPGELLVSINFPAPPKGFGANYIRFIPRNEMDIAVAGAGVSVLVANGKVKEARVTLSAVAPTPLFVKAAGDAMKGKAADAKAIQAAADAASKAAKPITDMRGTAEFRTHLCEVLTRRALETAIKRAKGGN